MSAINMSLQPPVSASYKIIRTNAPYLLQPKNNQQDAKHKNDANEEIRKRIRIINHPLNSVLAAELRPGSKRAGVELDRVLEPASEDGADEYADIKGDGEDEEGLWLESVWDGVLLTRVGISGDGLFVLFFFYDF